MNREKDTEHASDHWSGEELEAHYKLPWAMVGRVQCVERGPGGEPSPEVGEVIVRLPNWPDKLGDLAGDVDIVIGGPWLPMAERRKNVRTKKGAGLTPNQARELAQFLVEAADWADEGVTMATHPFTRLAEFPQYVFPCDGEVWVMTVHGDVMVEIAHEQNGTGEGDTEGWVVEMTRNLDGRWEIAGGAAELGANTRDTTPAALESLLNLHGVPK